ncbi:MAG: ATP-binding protein [Firmicutes bacterium]|nr:ATP-binding protein [Bacillota bacterium]MCM1401229.1 ATP-binding protein [Bacteroides sp.]MCM1477222.1 ATP-binding protein [Bacteroides sp.]
MKDIRASRGKYYLHKLIAEGENEHQDFKFQISDARKIARSISAFANNSGGRLLIGVKDNGSIAGVRNEEDIYVVEQAAQLYCKPAQSPKFSAYKAEEGAMVIIAEVDASARRPVSVSEADGSLKAFYRVADENILAHPLMVKAWKHKLKSQPNIISLSEAEQSLLTMLNSSGFIDPDKVPALCKVSNNVAEQLILRLYALSVIDFRFINRRFHLVPSDPSLHS